MQGRACQMIDLYVDKLIEYDVRFCVWNILCYNHVSFEAADEVYAALQWGEEAQSGKLFEPSRCQLSFALAGSNLTKYIAFIDLKLRELVYIDANFYGRVSSAANNGETLEQVMPAFLEYLDAQPSVYDLFKDLPTSKKGLPVLYSDKDTAIKQGQAWVFQKENQNNSFKQLEINKLLG